MINGKATELSVAFFLPIVLYYDYLYMIKKELLIRMRTILCENVIFTFGKFCKQDQFKRRDFPFHHTLQLLPAHRRILKEEL